ncbi:hypothetical protein C1646_777238 [Rhizophagus diaphanus]|nr:hypothetical protein C1646_777238 [Rhizophagus diaphanus] [Rhizophagus sp. MUCL 43196]
MNKYSSEQANMRTEDIESTLEFMKKKLKSISDQKNILVCAQQKASTIYTSFDKTIERAEIQDMLQAMIKKPGYFGCQDLDHWDSVAARILIQSGNLNLVKYMDKPWWKTIVLWSNLVPTIKSRTRRTTATVEVENNIVKNLDIDVNA